MRIGLINLEPKYVNIALEKLRLYHQIKGDEVEDIIEIEATDYYDSIYISSIFTWTDKKYVPKYATCGGSGFDLKNRLPDEIENMKPKINQGFTSRGCDRNCGFCIVPQKEGRFRVTGDIYDFWDCKSKEIVIMDNNILLSKKHFLKVADQILNENLKVDFNQGLDIRELDLDIAKKLKELKHKKQIRFAMDWVGMEKLFVEKYKILEKAGIKPSKIMVYVLVGFNTDIYQDLDRIEFVRSLDSDAFVMLYDSKKKDGLREHLSRWNNRFYFNLSFWDYLKAKKIRFEN